MPTSKNGMQSAANAGKCNPLRFDDVECARHRVKRSLKLVNDRPVAFDLQPSHLQLRCRHFQEQQSEEQLTRSGHGNGWRGMACSHFADHHRVADGDFRCLFPVRNHKVQVQRCTADNRRIQSGRDRIEQQAVGIAEIMSMLCVLTPAFMPCLSSAAPVRNMLRQIADSA